MQIPTHIVDDLICLSYFGKPYYWRLPFIGDKSLRYLASKNLVELCSNWMELSRIVALHGNGEVIKITSYGTKVVESLSVARRIEGLARKGFEEAISDELGKLPVSTLPQFLVHSSAVVRTVAATSMSLRRIGC